MQSLVTAFGCEKNYGNVWTRSNKLVQGEPHVREPEPDRKTACDLNVTPLFRCCAEIC